MCYMDRKRKKGFVPPGDNGIKGGVFFVLLIFKFFLQKSYSIF